MERNNLRVLTLISQVACQPKLQIKTLNSNHNGLYLALKHLSVSQGAVCRTSYQDGFPSSKGGKPQACTSRVVTIADGIFSTTHTPSDLALSNMSQTPG